MVALYSYPHRDGIRLIPTQGCWREAHTHTGWDGGVGLIPTQGWWMVAVGSYPHRDGMRLIPTEQATQEHRTRSWLMSPSVELPWVHSNKYAFLMFCPKCPGVFIVSFTEKSNETTQIRDQQDPEQARLHSVRLCITLTGSQYYSLPTLLL